MGAHSCAPIYVYIILEAIWKIVKMKSKKFLILMNYMRISLLRTMKILNTLFSTEKIIFPLKSQMHFLNKTMLFMASNIFKFHYTKSLKVVTFLSKQKALSAIEKKCEKIKISIFTHPLKIF